MGGDHSDHEQAQAFRKNPHFEAAVDDGAFPGKVCLRQGSFGRLYLTVAVLAKHCTDVIHGVCLTYRRA